MSTTRRGFLGYLLGTGAGLAASACKIEPATAEDLKALDQQAAPFDFACLPLDKMLISDVHIGAPQIEALYPSEMLQYSVGVSFRTWDYPTCRAIVDFFRYRQNRSWERFYHDRVHPPADPLG